MMDDQDTSENPELIAPGRDFCGSSEQELIQRYPYLLKYNRKRRLNKMIELGVLDYWHERQWQALRRELRGEQD